MNSGSEKHGRIGPMFILGLCLFMVLAGGVYLLSSLPKKVVTQFEITSMSGTAEVFFNGTSVGHTPMSFTAEELKSFFEPALTVKSWPPPGVPNTMSSGDYHFNVLKKPESPGSEKREFIFYVHLETPREKFMGAFRAKVVYPDGTLGHSSGSSGGMSMGLRTVEIQDSVRFRKP